MKQLINPIIDTSSNVHTTLLRYGSLRYSLYNYWSLLFYNKYIYYFFNCFVKRGKKMLAIKIVYLLLTNIKKLTLFSPVLILQAALLNYKHAIKLNVMKYRRRKVYSYRLLSLNRQVKFSIRHLATQFFAFNVPTLKYSMVDRLTIFILNLFYKTSLVYGRFLKHYTRVYKILDEKLIKKNYRREGQQKWFEKQMKKRKNNKFVRRGRYWIRKQRRMSRKKFYAIGGGNWYQRRNYKKKKLIQQRASRLVKLVFKNKLQNLQTKIPAKASLKLKNKLQTIFNKRFNSVVYNLHTNFVKYQKLIQYLRTQIDLVILKQNTVLENQLRSRLTNAVTKLNLIYHQLSTAYNYNVSSRKFINSKFNRSILLWKFIDDESKTKVGTSNRKQSTNFTKTLLKNIKKRSSVKQNKNSKKNNMNVRNFKKNHRMFTLHSRFNSKNIKQTNIRKENVKKNIKRKNRIFVHKHIGIKLIQRRINKVFKYDVVRNELYFKTRAYLSKKKRYWTDYRFELSNMFIDEKETLHNDLQILNEIKPINFFFADSTNLQIVRHLFIYLRIKKSYALLHKTYTYLTAPFWKLYNLRSRFLYSRLYKKPVVKEIKPKINDVYTKYLMQYINDNTLMRKYILNIISNSDIDFKTDKSFVNKFNLLTKIKKIKSKKQKLNTKTKKNLKINATNIVHNVHKTTKLKKKYLELLKKKYKLLLTTKKIGAVQQYSIEPSFIDIVDNKIIEMRKKYGYTTPNFIRSKLPWLRKLYNKKTIRIVVNKTVIKTNLVEFTKLRLYNIIYNLYRQRFYKLQRRTRFFFFNAVRLIKRIYIRILRFKIMKFIWNAFKALNLRTTHGVSISFRRNVSFRGFLTK